MFAGTLSLARVDIFMLAIIISKTYPCHTFQLSIQTEVIEVDFAHELTTVTLR